MGEGLGDLLRGREDKGDPCGEETECVPKGTVGGVGRDERVKEGEC